MNFAEFLKQRTGKNPPLNDKYGEWLGYQIDRVDKAQGVVHTSLPIRQDHLSPSGAVHGGVVSGFLDFTCGCAVFSVIEPEQLCSTVDLNVKYFKPIKEHEVIVAKAKVLHKGRSLSSVVAELYRSDNEEQLVAMASGTFNIYRLKK